MKPIENTTIPELTRENAEKLAKRVVEDMDLDTLVEFAEGSIADWYYLHCDNETWKEDWLLNMGGDV